MKKPKPLARNRLRKLTLEPLEERALLALTVLPADLPPGGDGGIGPDDATMGVVASEQPDRGQSIHDAAPAVDLGGSQGRGAIHHWRLDEGQGFRSDDAIGTADGTLVGLAGNAWRAGYHGTALAFDGQNGHVSVGQVPSLQLSNQVTVTTWVNVSPGGFANWAGIAGWVHDSGSDESGYCLNLWSDGGFSFGLATGSGTGGFDYLTETGYGSDRWYHVAGTYDGSYQRLYVDGVPVAAAPKSGPINWEWLDGDGLEIGRYHDDNEDIHFHGLIDDVRVYDRALDASEVAELASETPTTNNAPVARDEGVRCDGSTPVEINVLANDRDADGDLLSVVGFSEPSQGSVARGGDGRLTYTPGAGFHDGDSFTYTVSDGNGGTDTATVTVLGEPVGQWDFDDPLDLTAATIGADLILVGTDLAVDGVTPGDGAASLGVGDYYVVDHGIVPGGGGSRVNGYTLVFDFRVPAPRAWACFFQTDESNTGDGDFFVRDLDGTIGSDATGYSTVGVEAGSWYRLVVAVDNGSRYDVFLDGAKILHALPQPMDGRFSLAERLLVGADNDGQDGGMDVSMFAVFDRALSDAEVVGLGGPYQVDPSNTPPTVVPLPAGPASGSTQAEITFTFSADDADGDAVQFQIDWGDGKVSPWSDFQSAASSYAAAHLYNANGAMPIRANVRDEHGATSEFTLVHTIDIAGDVVGQFVTLPYLQNVTPESIVIMWEMNAAGAVAVEYGLTADYGYSTPATGEPSGFGGTHIYKAELGELAGESEYHYRLVAGGGMPLTGDRLFRTGTANEIDFAFGAWADSQGSNGGAWTADPLQPTTSMMAHMAQSGVDFGFGLGDLASSGSSYSDTRNYYLDRVAKYLGQTVPWFNAWGNHDSSSPGAILRRFADMPSKDRAGYTPGFGSYYFTYANCLFIAIDYYDDRVITNGWLENVLKSELNLNARFTIVGIHVPPYCELWIDGSSSLRSNLVPLLEQYGVDLCISGHTHEYERGFLNGVHYVITGGGSWLDLPEPLVHNWPHMTVGGYHDLAGTWATESSPGVLGPPRPIRAGLVNEYVRFEIRGGYLQAEMHAFNADGSYIGVLDRFGFGDTPGVNDPPAFRDALLLKPSARSWAEYRDSLSGDATDPDRDDVLTFSKTSGPAWLNVAADGTLSGMPGAADLGTNSFTVRVTDGGGLFDETALYITVHRGSAAVVGRHVFYDNSAFDTGPQRTDDHAIAPYKIALRPGESATFENYTSYDRGINGIMVDVAGLARPGGLDPDADFEFRVGNGNDLSAWTPAPAPQAIVVRESPDGTPRVTITWDDGAVRNQWLQVRIRATGNTGLPEDDVFYFGNAPGEAGDSPGYAVVNTTDEMLVRNHPHGPRNPAAIGNPYDYNRDGLVNTTDRIIARGCRTGPGNSLHLIRLPVPRVLITEVSTLVPDWLEIQNVSPHPVDVSGWSVAVNDATGNDVNAVHDTRWELSGTIGPGELDFRHDDSFHPEDAGHYWGEDIVWRHYGKGWVVILDDAQTVVDLVIWGYDASAIAAMNVVIDGTVIRAEGVWNGPAVPSNVESDRTLQRRGNSDHDNAADFLFTSPHSQGRTNPGLNIPFASTPSAGVEPDAGPPCRDDASFVDVAPVRDAVLRRVAQRESARRKAFPDKAFLFYEWERVDPWSRPFKRERPLAKAVDHVLRSYTAGAAIAGEAAR